MLRSDVLDDLHSVQAPVLYENLVGLPSGGNAASHEEPCYVRFHCFVVVFGLSRSRVDTDSHRFEERIVRLVAGQGEDEVVGDLHALTVGTFQPNPIRENFFCFGLEQCPDFSSLDAVLNVRSHPVFNVTGKLGFAITALESPCRVHSMAAPGPPVLRLRWQRLM